MSNQINNETKTAVEQLFEIYMDKKLSLTLEDFKAALEIERKQIETAFKSGKNLQETNISEEYNYYEEVYNL
jgi:hypothetical protein